jgi:hypothetical protein
MRWPAIAAGLADIDDWKPVSRAAAIIALSFYVLFLFYASFDRSGFLFLDYANLMPCGCPLTLHSRPLTSLTSSASFHEKISI